MNISFPGWDKQTLSKAHYSWSNLQHSVKGFCFSDEWFSREQRSWNIQREGGKGNDSNLKVKLPAGYLVNWLFGLQARFQQRQLQEKEEKLLRLYEEQQERQERALQRVKGPGKGPSMETTVGAGKVRSMLQCRRDHGRDKSYPLEPLPSQKNRKPKAQNLLYFGGSHQDLRFSDELDYGQSFQVIDDQLVYHDDEEDFYLKDFRNKREFYEHRLAGEDNLSDPFQRLPNVGRMSQKTEPPNKFKTFVSGKSSIGSGRSALPTRQITAPAKKSLTSPPARKPLVTSKSADTPKNGFLIEDAKKGLPPPPRPPTGRKTVSPPQRVAKPDSPATVSHWLALHCVVDTLHKLAFFARAQISDRIVEAREFIMSN